MTQRISEFFENDHREIDALLEATDFGAPEAVERFRAFDARLERHIQWEEEILFPEVAAKAPPLELGPIRVMRMEHVAIREHKAGALEALEHGLSDEAKRRVQAMLDVLKGHNMKEERILYPACDQMLTLSETKAILERVGARP